MSEGGDPLPGRNQAPARSGGRRGLLLGLGAASAGGVIGAVTLRRRPRTSQEPAPDGRYRSLTLAWSNPDRDPLLVVARQKGMFERYNLDVTVLPTTSGAEALGLFAQGRADAAAAPILTWLPRLYAGLPAQLICGLQNGSFRLLLPRGAHLDRILDLSGKRVAITDDMMADRVFLSVMLRRKGVDPQTVQWRTTPPDRLVDALARGEVDAAIVHDPLAWRLLQKNPGQVVERLNTASGVYSARSNQALGVTSARLASDPKIAIVLAFAMREAASWLNQNRLRVAHLLAGDARVEERHLLEGMLTHESRVNIPTGDALIEQVAEYVDELKLLNQMPDQVDSFAYARSICGRPDRPA